RCRRRRTPRARSRPRRTRAGRAPPPRAPGGRAPGRGAPLARATRHGTPRDRTRRPGSRGPPRPPLTRAPGGSYRPPRSPVVSRPYPRQGGSGEIVQTVVDPHVGVQVGFPCPAEPLPVLVLRHPRGVRLDEGDDLLVRPAARQPPPPPDEARRPPLAERLDVSRAVLGQDVAREVVPP